MLFCTVNFHMKVFTKIGFQLLNLDEFIDKVDQVQVKGHHLQNTKEYQGKQGKISYQTFVNIIILSLTLTHCNISWFKYHL